MDKQISSGRLIGLVILAFISAATGIAAHNSPSFSGAPLLRIGAVIVFIVTCIILFTEFRR